MYGRCKSLYVIEQYVEQVAKQDLTETWIVWNLLSSLYVSVQGGLSSLYVSVQGPLSSLYVSVQGGLSSLYVSVQGDFLLVCQCTGGFPLCMSVYRGDFPPCMSMYRGDFPLCMSVYRGTFLFVWQCTGGTFLCMALYWGTFLFVWQCTGGLSSLYGSVQGDFPLCMAVYSGDFPLCMAVYWGDFPLYGSVQGGAFLFVWQCTRGTFLCTSVYTSSLFGTLTSPKTAFCWFVSMTVKEGFDGTCGSVPGARCPESHHRVLPVWRRQPAWAQHRCCSRPCFCRGNHWCHGRGN